MQTITNNNAWPELPFDEFESTSHLLHMLLQAVGKYKLIAPFEPEWAHVVLYVTDRGLSTGLIPYKNGAFSIHIDLFKHELSCTTSWMRSSGFMISSMSVAEITKILFDTLRSIGVDILINPKPQEIPNPILFHENTVLQHYHPHLANAWWRIVLSSYCVMQRYHALFTGKTQPIGVMWGTFDLRDVRYSGKRLPIENEGPMSGYLRRNAAGAEQIEVGWWSGNPAYPKPAYFAFAYPQPKAIEHTQINPAAAHWETSLGEFILDYDDVRRVKDPAAELFAFCQSSYQACAEKAGWDPELISSGKPI